MQAIVQSKLKAANESSNAHKAKRGGGLSRAIKSDVCLRLSTRDPSRLMMLTLRLTQGSERWHHNGHTHARARGPRGSGENVPNQYELRARAEDVFGRAQHAFGRAGRTRRARLFVGGGRCLTVSTVHPACRLDGAAVDVR